MKVVSFFSGLGGLDKGFLNAGYDIIWANDFDKFAVATYKANFGDHIVLGDINEIPLAQIPDCDVLIGGFHFSNLPLDDTLRTYAQYLDSFPTRYYTCHCTGEKQYAFMRQTMKHLHYLSCGDTICL